MYRKKEVKKEKISDFSSPEFKDNYEKLKEYNIGSEDLIKFYKIKHLLDENLLKDAIKRLEKKEPEIPISVFSKELSCLETIAKYLYENLGFSYKEIARLTKRSEKTIWQAHNSSKKKLPSKFKVEFSKFYIPVSILADRRLSVLESIVKYLHENLNLKFSEIAKLLQRDERTVWTVYSRAKKKNAR